MTLTTRDQPTQQISLTRTKVNTIAWLLRTASTPVRPVTTQGSAKARASRQADNRPVILTRTRHDTVRWLMSGSPWGAVTIAFGVLAALTALIGLWLLVPAIDAAVAAGLAGTEGMFDWLIGAIGNFPKWLGSLF